MRIIIFGLIIVILGSIFVWVWQGKEETTTQLDELTLMSIQFLDAIIAENYEEATRSFMVIKQLQRKMAVYLYPNKESHRTLSTYIHRIENLLFLDQPNRQEILPQVMTYYYIIDGLTHRSQPYWLFSLKEMAWEKEEFRQRLDHYRLIRPAISLSIDKKVVTQLDQLVASYSSVDTEQTFSLIQKIEQELAAHSRLSILNVLLIMSLAIGVGLSCYYLVNRQFVRV